MNFLISLLIHIFIFLCLMTWKKTSPLPETSLKSDGNSIHVEIMGKTSKRQPPPKQKLSSKPSKPRKQDVPLSALGFLNSQNPFDAKKTQEQLMPRTKETTDQPSDGYEMTNGMDMKQESLLQPFLRALYERIQNNLDYPRPIIEAGREGEISLQFKVDKNGKLIESFSSVHAEDRILKVLVFQVLRRALQDPLHQILPKGQTELKIGANFQFLITSHSDSISQDTPEISKNTLRFRRYAINPRMHRGPLEGMGPDGKVHHATDTDPGFHSKLELDPNGILSVNSDSANGAYSTTAGVDVLKLYNWVFGKKKNFDPLERYKSDPDY